MSAPRGSASLGWGRWAARWPAGSSRPDTTSASTTSLPGCRGTGRRLGATVEQLWNLGDGTFPDDGDYIDMVRMFEEWANVTIESGSERSDRR